MKIAVIYNRESQKVINLFGVPNREKYGLKAISRIVNALKKGGHLVTALEGDKDLIDNLETFPPAELVFGEGGPNIYTLEDKKRQSGREIKVVCPASIDEATSNRAREMPWVQFELSRGSYASREQKSRWLLESLTAWTRQWKSTSRQSTSRERTAAITPLTAT